MSKQLLWYHDQQPAGDSRKSCWKPSPFLRRAMVASSIAYILSRAYQDLRIVSAKYLKFLNREIIAASEEAKQEDMILKLDRNFSCSSPVGSKVMIMWPITFNVNCRNRLYMSE